MAVGENGFGVELRQGDGGVSVVITDGSGVVLSERPCADTAEAER